MSAKASKTAPKFKSAEFINDSDSEPKEKGKKSSKSEKPQASKKRKLTTSTSPPAKRAKPTTPSKPPPQQSSGSKSKQNGDQEREQESDSEGEEERSRTAAAVAPSSSSKPPTAKKINGVKELEEAADGSENDDGENTGYESASEQQSHQSQSTSKPNDAETPRPKQVPSPTFPKRSRPFEPPRGFEAISSQPPPNEKLQDLLDRSNLEGKRIWHIVAPASVPISSLEHLNPDDVSNGKTIMRHNGVDYSLSKGKSEHARASRILVRHKEKPAFRLHDASFNRILFVEQVLPKRTANGSSGSRAAGVVNIPPVREPKKLPDGLRTRFWPPGFEPSATSHKLPPVANKEQAKSSASREVEADSDSSAADSAEDSAESSPSESSSAPAKSAEKPQTETVNGTSDRKPVEFRSEESESSEGSESEQESADASSEEN